ncbi:MAG TPA: 2'-5' RNA ligase family protein [Kofleriaceae bacterium]|nr:2'-5' RNA ligase family protein [Kofleriaceae bacterium]
MIVAPVDEPGAWIRDVRSRYDPIAAAVPPHVTLVYPFEDDIALDALGEHLTDALAAFTAFEVTLEGVSGAEGTYLRYDIKRGNDTLIAMHDRLYTGPLARHLDLRASFHPHLTIGRIADAARWRAALDELAANAPRATVAVGRVLSYRRYADGTRHMDHAIALRPAPGALTGAGHARGAKR